MAHHGSTRSNLTMPRFISAVWNEDYQYLETLGDGPPSDLMPGLDDPTFGAERSPDQMLAEQSLAAMILVALIAIVLIFVTIGSDVSLSYKKIS